jgi:vitamin B12 transporter
MRPFFLRAAFSPTHFVCLTFFLCSTPTWGAEQTPVSQVPSSASATLQVIPPRLEHFEPAVYPREASQAGLQATVSLRLDIDASGRVTGVKVVEAAGHGFDEAAAEAARHFTFSPARRAELPVASRILYRYEFTLSASTEEAKPSAPVVPEAGELRGILLGGEPPIALARAEVRVQATDGSWLSDLSDPSGQFVFPHLPPGKYVVHLDIAGFEPVAVVERVDVNRATALKYILSPKQQDEFQVTVHGAAVHREVTHYELSRRELLRVPGTFGDAVHRLHERHE